MRKVLIALAVTSFFIMAVGYAYAYEATQGPTELIYYDSSKAYNGYTLLRGLGGMEADPGTAWLLDMYGNVVHSWSNVVANPQLLPDGNLLNSLPARSAEQDSWIKELDWDGNLVNMWETPADIIAFHHDQLKIFNKKLNQYTMLSLNYLNYTLEEALANGGDPSKFTGDKRACGLVEMDMDGNVIWEWRGSDHYCQDFDPTKNNYVANLSDAPGKFDINYASGCAESGNGIDYNETLGQILWDGKGIPEIWIIDHQGTFIPGDPEGSKALAASDAGDLVYRWGNPCVYGAGDAPYYEYGKYGNGHKQLFNIHNGQWIDDGLPGAGHFLVFDNGYERMGATYSTVLEIDPYDGPMENGIYVPEMEAGHGAGNLSNQVVWRFNTLLYHNNSYQGFFSNHISGAERQPNGNTLMCSGEPGHLVEVTCGDLANGVFPEVVWEYINPDTYTHGIQKWLTLGMYNQVYRAHRYGPDYPGLAGRDLTPMGKITDRAGIEAIQDKLQNFLAQ